MTKSPFADISDAFSLRILPQETGVIPVLKTQIPCPSCARFEPLYGHNWSKVNDLTIPSAAWKQRELVRKAEIKVLKKGTRDLGKAVGIDALKGQVDALEELLSGWSVGHNQIDGKKELSSSSSRYEKSASMKGSERSKTKGRHCDVVKDNRTVIEEPEVINVGKAIDLAQKTLDVFYVR